MSPATAFFLGVFCGFMIVAITAWWAVTWFRDEPSRGFGAVAVAVRVFAARSSYRSVLVDLGHQTLVVPLERLALAIEQGHLLAHLPVTLTRSDRPPPLPHRSSRREPPDGHA